jgi:hypothetical protein
VQGVWVSSSFAHRAADFFAFVFFARFLLVADFLAQKHFLLWFIELFSYAFFEIFWVIHSVALYCPSVLATPALGSCWGFTDHARPCVAFQLALVLSTSQKFITVVLAQRNRVSALFSWSAN